MTVSDVPAGGGTRYSRHARRRLRTVRRLLLRVRPVALLLVVAVAGAWVAVALVGSTTRDVGPFQARLSVHPGWPGHSVLAVPPLGTVRFGTHSGPVVLEVRVTAVDPQALSRLTGQDDLQAIGADVRADLRLGLVVLVLKTCLLAIGGAALAVLLVLRRPRQALVASGLATVVLVAVGTVTAGTWTPRALNEPTFTGTLTYAPALIGDVQDVVARLGDYTRQLGGLVDNVSNLYDTASTLPTFTATSGTVRLLHISDLHLSPSAYPLVKDVVRQFGVDVVLDTGDVADHGSAVESAYVDGIRTLGVPYVYVPGNHDSVLTAAAVRAEPGTSVLDDGRTATVAGLTFLGQADPRFTPDKRTQDDTAPQSELEGVGEHLLQVVRAQDLAPDVVAVHDPLSAQPLIGHVPLVLAGHTHARKVTEQDGTRLMVEGSTGGAGLRALEGDTPTPVEMTVLYLDRATGALQAYDEITLGGLGLSDARIRRQVVPRDGADASPSLSPSPSLLPSPSGAGPVPASAAVPTPVPVPVRVPAP